MITLAVHHDETVFVYLSETDTKNIKQLGFISPDFQFNRAFLHRSDAPEQFGKMLGEILKQLKIPGDTLYISFPADLVHLSRYDEVPESEVQDLIDQDLWLNKLKFGDDFIEQSDCQVRLLHKKDKLAFLNALYFPKAVYDIFSAASRKHHCTLAAIGLNLFNLGELVRHISDTEHNMILFLEEQYCELMHMEGELPVGYARFACTPGPMFFSERQGNIPEELCEMIAGNTAEDPGKYPLYAASSVTAIKYLYELRQRIPTLQIVDPLSVKSVYSKPETEFDNKYDPVFAGALGALL